jgi:diguanylate cyclase (GGDEF)-like protein
MTEHDVEKQGSQQKQQVRRDALVLLAALVLGFLSVLVFDTGSVADWIGRHRDTKIDEAIVITIVLAVGLSIFSIRRWLELSNQVRRFEELHHQMHKLTRESTLLAELGDLLQSCLSPAEAHKLIVEHSQVLFPSFSGAVCVTASSRDVVEAVAVWGEPALKENAFPPGDCWALRRGRVHYLSNEASPILACAHMGHDKPEYAMCVPMMAQGEALGILYLDSGRYHHSKGTNGSMPTDESSQSQLRLAKTLAEHIALALANLNLREVLRSQSIRDPLTGLFNRRYMEESLERELRRATRKKSSLGMMMVDVDHFKRFNDSFGHDAGDALLSELAKILKNMFRGEDIVCRYGGEEFTIILPEATLQATHDRAEHVRTAAKDAIAQYRGLALDHVTLSVGVSAFPEKGLTAQALLRSADAALYRAKEEGRDRVVLG